MDTVLLSMSTGDCSAFEEGLLFKEMCIPGLTPPYDGSETESTKEHLPEEHSLFEEVDKMHTQNMIEELNSTLEDDDLNGDLPTVNMEQLKQETTPEKKNEDSTTCSVICELQPHKSPQTDTSSPSQCQMNDSAEKLTPKPIKRTAIIARQTRARKKVYIQNLEKENARLKSENEALEEDNSSLKTRIKSLEDDVEYFKNILENESDLCKVVKAVSNVPGMELNPKVECRSTAKDAPEKVESRKRQSKKSENSSEPKAKQAKVSVGICLHVQKGKISLEMCAKCNNSR